MRYPELFAVSKTSMPHASIEGRAMRGFRHVRDCILQMVQRLQDPPEKAKALRWPSREIRRSRSVSDLSIFPLSGFIRNMSARLYSLNMARVSVGVGE